VAQPPQPRAPRRSSEERNEEIRAGLTPLEPGERPTPLLAATIAAAGLGLANLVLFAAGNDGAGASPSTAVVYCGLLFLVAWGLWRKHYLAVLGFEVLLAAIVIFFFVFLLRASTVWAALLSLAIISPAGYLFWKLIRVLARIQTPRDDDPGPT
jgi:hypothetical protein